MSSFFITLIRKLIPVPRSCIREGNGFYIANSWLMFKIIALECTLWNATWELRWTQYLTLWKWDCPSSQEVSGMRIATLANKARWLGVAILFLLLFIVQHVEQYGNKGKLHSSIFSFPVLWRYKVKPTLFFPLGYFPPVVTVHVSLLKNFVACFKLFCNQCLLSSLWWKFNSWSS